MASYQDTMRTLASHNLAKRWDDLRASAVEAAAEFTESADIHAYAAHAMRQLGQLEQGFDWAQRALAIDPDNLFARNRVSLLANLTQRYAEAYAVATPILDLEPVDAPAAQNIAVVIVNAIHAASHLGKIAEAVELFTPAIVRLDHEDLHFNSACMYALAADDRVYAYARKALAAGKPKDAFVDTDFDGVRSDPRLIALLARDWDAERSALERSGKRTRDALAPEDFVALLSAGTANLERHPELERAIDANIDDVDAYIVYSDWLQGQSNPRGHFILASRRCHDARTEDDRMLAYVDWAAHVVEHAGAYLGAYAPVVGDTTWHLGFVREHAFDYGSSADAAALLVASLALPVCRFVRGVTIGDIPAFDRLSYDTMVAALADAQLHHLRSLRIAPDEFQMSWSELDVSSLAMPHLESLVIGAGTITTGALAFPALRRFAIRTGGLTRDNLTAVEQADWPHLEDLEVWFGSTEYGAAAFTPHDLARFLQSRRPLRRLALRNAELADDICAALVGAPILPTLAELDLSMGTLTYAGADILVRNRQHFAHLARLDVGDNCIPPDAAEMLRRALPNVHIGSQKRGRYVSVGE